MPTLKKTPMFLEIKERGRFRQLAQVLDVTEPEGMLEPVGFKTLEQHTERLFGVMRNMNLETFRILGVSVFKGRICRLDKSGNFWIMVSGKPKRHR